MKTIGLVFFVLFSMVSVGYSACEGDFDCDGDVDGSDLAVFAADFGRTDCGPCEDVIDLIEALESRIESLENKTPKGYNARCTTPIIEPSETMIPVCTLTIPPGDYVMTMIMKASYFYQGSFNPVYTTYVECACTEPNGNKIMGCGIGGSVSNHSELSQTIGQWTNDDIPYITIQCKHNPMEGSDTIGIDISWTAIKVDEINFQPQ
jgi:hypothetical protein